MIGTVNLVELTKVGWRKQPPIYAAVDEVKPAPLMVSVKPAPPAVAFGGLMLVNCKGVEVVL